MSSSLTSSSAADGTRAVTARRGPNAVQRCNRAAWKWLWHYNYEEDCSNAMLYGFVYPTLILSIPVWGPFYAAWWLVASERKPLARILFGSEEDK